jgi:hypothetical protein
MTLAAAERRLDALLLEAYQRAKSEAKYNATIFFRMLGDHRGLYTARYLINSPIESDGYTQLYLRGRLDLTVEAVVIENRSVHALFSEEELERARRRLVARKYDPVLRD